MIIILKFKIILPNRFPQETYLLIHLYINNNHFIFSIWILDDPPSQMKKIYNAIAIKINSSKKTFHH